MTEHAAREPVRFIFAVHLHQPVGNFDHVFEQHLADVYRPLIERLAERDFAPIAIHVSGPLLDWLEAHAPAYLDRLARLADNGKLEFLLAGYDEPILATLPRADRIEQIQRMRDAIRRRFGADASCLWLTERVWEPDLAADLADAGVRSVIVDDRHFLVSGFARDQLHAPYRTESNGRHVSVFPIDERLRYLIPFRPPSELVTYFRDAREAGYRLAVLADDGEKFGGWPGTKEWVYDRGWLTAFLDAMDQVRSSGEVRLTTFSEALEAVPCGGLCYLPTASYREMEGWSLPPDAALALGELERMVEPPARQPEQAPRRASSVWFPSLVRGGHWKHFLVKYPESNRAHKKMLALSRLCRERGDPPEARRAIGRAQCNDAYWHGVFGGLYLPHLREAIWANLADAEALLRRNDGLAVDEVDIDSDGRVELWVHSPHFSAVVSPARGGSLEDYTVFRSRLNFANVLTRRREAYHAAAVAPREAADPHRDGGHGTASIHDIEKTLALDARPAVDADERALFQERLHPAGIGVTPFAQGGAPVLQSWTRQAFAASVRADAESATIELTADGLVKRYRFTLTGEVDLALTWSTDHAPDDGWFSSELSLFRPLDMLTMPEAVVLRYPIETVAKSERGLDRTRQGEAFVLCWPAPLGAASVRVAAPPVPPI